MVEQAKTERTESAEATCEDIWGDERSLPLQSMDVQPREEQAREEQSWEYAVFDIETGPLPETVLMDLAPPFQPPPHPGEFDENTVKLGNLKDQSKIDEKIRMARSAHASAVANYEQSVAAARDQHFADFVSRAALDATTGRVVAIGIGTGDARRIIDASDDEVCGLQEWWQFVMECWSRRCPMIGFNILHFDLPFLVRRSWLLGVPVPGGVRVGRYWSELFVDLMAVWAFHGRDMIKLDSLAKAFGVGEKVKAVGDVEVSGADFHRVWRENRAVAEAYLMADLELPAKLARRMGII